MVKEYSNKGTKKYFGNPQKNNAQINLNKKSNGKKDILEKNIENEVVLLEPNPLMFIMGMFSEIIRIYQKFKS